MEAEKASSKPTVLGFRPVIPYQKAVIDLIDTFDYETDGVLEILLSGSYGSAKSILMAHLVITHCLFYARAEALIGRKALPDLEKTLWQEILDHLEGDYIEGKDYWVNRSKFTIRFANGSKIISGYWTDGKFRKFRSLRLSMAVIEELTENDDKDRQSIQEIKSRLNRREHIPENVFIAGTNPDSPKHWAYKYFILPNLRSLHRNRRVFYSRSKDNPFLKKSYVEQLERDLSPREAKRFINGEWLELQSETIYYAYGNDNFKEDLEYTVNKGFPVHISWDFNIGEGKPMSCILFQYIEDTFHFFAESVLFSARTADTIDDFEARGLLDKEVTYIINGDAAGKHRDTRSNQSDYDIIRKAFSNLNLKFVYQVLASNPPIRNRHNRVNGYCLNSLGERRLFIYKGCVIADEGMRLTGMKKGASFIEDDSKSYQHITTAIGYGIIQTLAFLEKKTNQSRTRDL